jgi:hypothetical protein
MAAPRDIQIEKSRRRDRRTTVIVALIAVFGLAGMCSLVILRQRYFRFLQLLAFFGFLTHSRPPIGDKRGCGRIVR